MNNVEQDLPLSEWGGQLAGAVSGVFLRKFPNFVMPSEEVAAIVDQFLSAPPADVPLNWTAPELLEVDQPTWWEPENVTALRLAVDIHNGIGNTDIAQIGQTASSLLAWLRKNQPDE